MSTIRELFDSSRALSRPIEKVITYQNRSEKQLRAEVSEYIVTKHIEENFEDLLKKMQRAQQEKGSNEIGVWVSGFYGSGKSSFTKYLGFALDRDMKVGGDPFLHLLQHQLGSAGAKALFNQVSQIYNAAVIFLDLASEMLAGASMEDISTVLYLKTLQWAGYSEDLKVAELERMLEADVKLDDFKARAKEELDGIDWEEVHNQPLVANQIASRLAVEFYPALFKTKSDFQDLTIHVNKSEIKRAEEMIQLIRQKSGKQNILFIIDEVGQYVSAKPNLILNLDGLAKNLKAIGKGSVWLFATAQQTLTEDNPNAALNSPGLFKLKDRFPIQVHLEASDIKEICHRRLLTKSSSGQQKLSTLFDQYGSSLRTATALRDAGVYDVELTKKIYTDLYPFLPAHFEILLQLLGRLAKKTGGLGLRSAIKVVQEILVDRGRSHSPLADGSSGQLANTVTFYDSLQRDIQSSFSYVVDGVERVTERLPNMALCKNIAKSIAVLQILENLPVTAENIAALLQPDVTSPSIKDDVKKAIDTILLKDTMIPLGEKNGSLRFLTQTAVTLQKKFDQIEYRHADLRAELNGTLRSIFSPLPSVRIEGARPVTAGLRMMMGGGQSVSLEGEKEAIQLHIEFVLSSKYNETRKQLEDDSRSSKERASIFLLGRAEVDSENLAVTLVRCRKFLDTHRNVTDPETQEFVRIIDARVERTTSELERKLSYALFNGSFIAHGSYEAASSHGANITEAAKSFLAGAAAKVFSQYPEAAHQADSKLAEKFLKTPIDRVTSQEDPLGLISRAGGQPKVNTTHQAFVSMCDYLRQMGQVEGRRLLDHFAAPPFGWSKDTIRYLLAGAFLGGEIKLRISGKDHQVKSDESLTAFASNREIGPVGVSLREDKADPEALIRASDRLRDLTGEGILPLEDEIAAAAKKQLPGYQKEFGPLKVELFNLGLPEECSERAESLVNDIAEILSGDGSDAVSRLGGVESPLNENLVWAQNLKKALDNGLRKILSHLQRLKLDIEDLPSSGVPGKLKTTAVDTLVDIEEALSSDFFFEKGAALASAAAVLDKMVDSTVTDLAKQQQEHMLNVLNHWHTSEDWQVIGEEDRNWFNDQVANLPIEAEGALDGLKKLLNHDFTLNYQLRGLDAQLKERANTQRYKLEESQIKLKWDKSEEDVHPDIAIKSIILPASLNTADEIKSLIDQLTEHMESIRKGALMKVVCRVIEDSKSSSGNTYL